jgi:predicted permease
MSGVLQDLRYAMRQLRKSPGFACTAVLILALGIGGTTAIFSAVNPILFEPMPYPHAGRIMMIWYAGQDGSRIPQTFHPYRELAERSRSFDAIAVMKPWQPTLNGADQPERFDGQQMPYIRGLSLNLHVLAFACAISVLAAALFSLAPIVRLPLTKLREGLTEGGRGYAGTLWRRFGANLVVLELAIAVVLLVSAGLLGKSFYRLLHVELGFQPDHLATLQVALPDDGYGKDEQEVAVGRQIASRVASLPGVASVGISSVLPVSFNGNTTWIRFLGRPYHGEHNEVNQREVSSAFFGTLQAKLLQGRYFTDAEDASKPRVVIINQALAKQYFPGEDPVGEKIGDTDLSPASLTEIIGVVADVKDGSLDSEIWPAIYYPFNQNPGTYFFLVVRTSQAEQSLLGTLVAAIHQIDPGIGTSDEATMAERINDSPSAYLHRSSAWLVGGFAAAALLLGVVGLYGVIAYSVSQRTREIGVRMALGAQRSSVYQLLLKEAAWLAGAGIAGGLVCSIVAATLIRGILFRVRSWDAATFVTVSVVLAISALLASYIPARRAAKVDPMVALRYE